MLLINVLFTLLVGASADLWSQCFTTGVETFCRGTDKNQVGAYFQNLTKFSTSLSWLGGNLGDGFDLSDWTAEDFSMINVVSLQNNSIRSFAPGFLRSFTLLDTLSIQVNPIEKLDSGFLDKTRVRTVLLRRVPLQTIDQVFVDNKLLEFLTIESSQLVEIKASTFVNLPKLKHLEISWSPLESIDRQSLVQLPKLQVLSFRFNNLTSFDKEVFANVQSLQELNFEGNHLDQLDDDFFADLPQLTRVHLNRNNLTSFNTCKGAVQLHDLDLSDNIDLQLSTFSQCQQIETLGLAGLNIKNLDVAEIFAQTPSIQTLNLARNHLTNLDVETLIKTLPNLRLLDLEKNPWKCNSLSSFKNYLDQVPTITVTWGPRYYDINNIDGIPCNYQ